MWIGVCELAFVSTECTFCVCWSSREVPSGLIVTGYLLTLRLYAILDGRSIFTYVWNWLYNIIVIEFITKTWCKEQFCELNREFRCLVMRIPVDNIYNFVMLTKVYKIVPLPTCSSSSEYVGYQSINLDLMFKVN